MILSAAYFGWQIFYIMLSRFLTDIIELCELHNQSSSNAFTFIYLFIIYLFF